jgi:hypothetical protein
MSTGELDVSASVCTVFAVISVDLAEVALEHWSILKLFERWWELGLMRD